MFKIAELDTVFMRPRQKHDGEIAYMTGFWIGRYMKELAGQDAINRLLLAYRDGKSDDEAVKAAVNMSVADFDAKFAEWSKKQVEKWGYDKDSAAKFKKAFDRGEEMMKANKIDEAWTSFSEATKLQPYNHMPHRRLAAIAMRQKKPDDALVHLRWLVPLEFRDNRFAKSVALMYKQQDDVPKAIEFAELAVKTDPYDPLAHDLLGELYQKAGDERALRETEVAALLRLRAEEATKPKDAPKQD
jgi:predicted Zn-dependent protease